MALVLDYKHQMKVSALSNREVISHLRGVLNTYVNKPQYSRFYIGITSKLEERRVAHQSLRPQFTLMCPIYEDPNPRVDMAFHSLEQDAINQLRAGIVNPTDSRNKMICENRAGGSVPKNWLYILLG